MSDEVETFYLYENSIGQRPIHKLIQPTPQNGRLSDLILCYNNSPSFPTTRILGFSFNVNINHVTCPECIALWKSGVYR